MAVEVSNVICFTLNCASLETSLAFYTEALGATVVQRMHPEEVEVHDFWGSMGYEPGVAYEAVLLQLGSHRTETYLELIEWERPAEATVTGARERGLARFSIAVGDADAAHRDMTDRGVTVKGPPVTNQLGNLTIKAFLMLDPDGVPIELVEFGRGEGSA